MAKVIEATTLPLADGDGDLGTGSNWRPGRSVSTESTRRATKRSAGRPTSTILRATSRVGRSVSARPRGSPTTTWSSRVYSLLSASWARRSRFHPTAEPLTSSTRRRVGTSRRVPSLRGSSGSRPSCRHGSSETATPLCSNCGHVGLGERSRMSHEAARGVGLPPNAASVCSTRHLRPPYKHSRYCAGIEIANAPRRRTALGWASVLSLGGIQG